MFPKILSNQFAKNKWKKKKKKNQNQNQKSEKQNSWNTNEFHHKSSIKTYSNWFSREAVDRPKTDYKTVMVLNNYESDFLRYHLGCNIYFIIFKLLKIFFTNMLSKELIP